MIWVTYRQQRLELIMASAVLAVLATVLLLAGYHLAVDYHQLGVSSCLSGSAASGDRCNAVMIAFSQRVDSIGQYVGWLNFLPLLFGVLLAVPVLFEFEHGTFRLAWTQSIPRDRWLLYRLGFVVIGAVIAGLIVMATMTYWRIPVDRVSGNLDPNDAFGFEGIVPVAYSLFAVALVLAAGLALKRTAAAVGVSVIAFLAVRLPIQNVLRQNFVAPMRVVYKPSNFAQTKQLGPHRNDWVLSQGFVNHAGREVTTSQGFNVCKDAVLGLPKGSRAMGDAFTNCLANHGIYAYTTFQPASRFWTLQFIEGGIFVGLAVALLAFSVIWVRRRLE